MPPLYQPPLAKQVLGKGAFSTVYRCVAKLPDEADLLCGESFDERVFGLRHSALARDDRGSFKHATSAKGRGSIRACKVVERAALKNTKYAASEIVFAKVTSETNQTKDSLVVPFTSPKH